MKLPRKRSSLVSQLVSHGGFSITTPISSSTPQSPNNSSFPPQRRRFSMHPLHFFLLAFAFFFGSTLTPFVHSHEESGEWSCEPDPESRVTAEFVPGLVTIDGHGDDWRDIDGFEFSLLPALDPDKENEYKGGKMSVKVKLDLICMYNSIYNCIYICTARFNLRRS